MQIAIVAVVLVAAVAAALWLAIRPFRQDNPHCAGCPLADACNKKSKGKCKE